MKKRLVSFFLFFVMLTTATLASVPCYAGGQVLSLVEQYRNSHYYELAAPGGDIEKKYTQMGEKQIAQAKYEAGNTVWKDYEVWYPADMQERAASYPLVIMVNGTGYPVSKYREVLKHLASWGFIVAGNEDENSRTGKSTAATLDFMLAQNEDPSSIFYQKIDTDHIGVGGHSQGGVGTINAVTKQPNGGRYTCMWVASPTSPYWGQDDVFGPEWSYDMTKVKIPCIMVAGTGIFDAGTAEDITPHEGQGICPLWGMKENYDAIPDDVPKVMGRLKNKDHGDLARYADGYMTAWFMYYLKNEQEAGKAFFGDSAEMKNNPNWQDVKSSPGEQAVRELQG